jgi:hemerythrin-like metal-binding protein
MSMFEWDDQFVLGMPEIDAQHKTWFNLTNEFVHLVQRGEADAAAVRRALAASVAYARKHLEFEEAFMRRIGYPKSDYEWHQMTHNAFVERVTALAKRCREGRPKVVTEMAVFMCGWMRTHILKVDVTLLRFYLVHTGWKPGAPKPRAGSDALGSIPVRRRRLGLPREKLGIRFRAGSSPAAGTARSPTMRSTT